MQICTLSGLYITASLHILRCLTDYLPEQCPEFGDPTPPRRGPRFAPESPTPFPMCRRCATPYLLVFANFFFARKSTFSFVDAIAGQRERATGVICPLEMRGIEWRPLSHIINPRVISFGCMKLAFVCLRCRLSCSHRGRTYFCSEGFHLLASVRSRL